MAEKLPKRTSRRRKVPNKKYSIDPFEGLDILSSGSDEPANRVANIDDPEDDEDFLAQEAIEEAEESEDAVISAAGASDDSGIETPNDEAEEDQGSGSGGSEDNSNMVKSRVCRSARTDRKPPKAETRTRGLVIPDSFVSISIENHNKSLFGIDPKDQLLAVHSRDKWVHDTTLPSRNADEDEIGGMGHPFGHSKAQRRQEATTGWDWYYESGGRDMSLRKQDVQLLSQHNATSYLPQSSESVIDVLMGPYGRQKLYSLASMTVLSVDEAFRSYQGEVSSDNTGDNPVKRRNGWMLNVGSKVRSLDWAPNHDGDIQYLAVSTSHERPERTQRSAFQPSEPCSACIQIWSFGVSLIEGQEGMEDPSRQPKIVQYVCNNWGVARHLKWCPAPRESRDEVEQGNIFVGLLAAVWDDGYIRVLNIQIDKNEKSSINVLYREAAFESRPPTTICTCLTWLSGTELAAGCANGFLAIWNIAKSILSQKVFEQEADSFFHGPNNISSPKPSFLIQPPHPFFYQSIHQSYIIAIQSCYPDHPHLLNTSSMDGFVRLTDLRAPNTDFVESVRTRNGIPSLAYSSPLQSLFAPEERDFVRLFPIRRFFKYSNIARASGLVLSMDMGKVHTCLLVGSADGSVMVTNPMRRLTEPKQMPFQQIWFRHEWARKPEQKHNSTPVTDIDISRPEVGGTDRTSNSMDQSMKEIPDHPVRNQMNNEKFVSADKPADNNRETVQNDIVPSKSSPGVPIPRSRKGTSRITEGYKVEQKNMSRNSTHGFVKDAPIFATIHEEESHVTQVCWNPNLKCGGWAAAGCGSGLVRVEDLAIG